MALPAGRAPPHPPFIHDQAPEQSPYPSHNPSAIHNNPPSIYYQAPETTTFVYDDVEPPHELDMRRFRQVNYLIRQKDCAALLGMALDRVPVNLMRDPLLSVVIASGKYYTDLALQLIGVLSPDAFPVKNFYGDTALHVAAATNAIKVARALVLKNSNLADLTNNKQETALHKAALNGHSEMFWYLAKEGKSEPKVRREDGSTVLHCAIMGNAPVLALEIAKQYPELIYSRNDLAVTPLQLMVTIPDLFRSRLQLGPVESFFYDWIPLDEDRRESRGSDEESPPGRSKIGAGIEDDGEGFDNINDREGNIRSKFPPQYGTLFDLLELIRGQMVAWIVPSVFNILKLFSKTVKNLEKYKRTHTQALELVGHFATNAKDVRRFDFYCKGYTGTRTSVYDPDPTALMFPGGPGIFELDRGSAVQDQSKRQLLFQFTDKLSRFLSLKSDEPESATKELVNSMKKVLEEMSGESDVRWHESPLITGTKLGLDDFVLKILHVYPQSATYLDDDGRTVLEAAIKYGRKEIVKTIGKMTRGSNPLLPSWLFSHVDANTRNTILHFASESVETVGDAVQLQDQMKWFEMVKKIVPEELRNYRNNEEKTAQELFSEKHEAMVGSCKTQLVEMGKTCSSLVAAVVFASSFSIPGEKNPSTGIPHYFDRLLFKIFSHAYAVGFGCSATSLVLFLSLVITPYKERDFRRAVPMLYFLACLSFAMALLAFLISFACNIFLQIYGGQRTEKKDLITLLLELTVFPAVCFIVLLYNGARFGPSFSRLWAAA